MESMKMEVECDCCKDSKRVNNPKYREINDMYYDLLFHLTDKGVEHELAEELAALKYPRSTVAEYITCPHCSTGVEIKEEKKAYPIFDRGTITKLPDNGEEVEFTWFDFMESAKK